MYERVPFLMLSIGSMRQRTKWGCEFGTFQVWSQSTYSAYACIILRLRQSLVQIQLKSSNPASGVRGREVIARERDRVGVITRSAVFTNLFSSSVVIRLVNIQSDTKIAVQDCTRTRLLSHVAFFINPSRSRVLSMGWAHFCFPRLDGSWRFNPRGFAGRFPVR